MRVPISGPIAIFFAGYLVDKREVLATSSTRFLGMAIPEARHLGPILVAWGASLLVMVFEKDLGSSLLFFALFVVLLWVATERPSYLLMSLVMFAVGAAFSYNRFAHVQDRVEVWLEPFDDPFGEGRDAVYGREGPLDQFVRTIRAGALGIGDEASHFVPCRN